MQFDKLKKVIDILHAEGPTLSADLAQRLGYSRLGSGGLTKALVRTGIVEKVKGVTPPFLRLTKLANYLIDQVHGPIMAEYRHAVVCMDRACPRCTENAKIMGLVEK